MQTEKMHVIARIHSEFPEKFGIPRQSGLVPGLRARIVFEPEFRNPDALRGIEGFSHLWLIWQFSQTIRETWSPTVRPPRLGGNRRVGVFATRSPFRPNPIGLSCVKLEAVLQDPKGGTVLEVSGADLLDGTPIFDIKPYRRCRRRLCLNRPRRETAGADSRRIGAAAAGAEANRAFGAFGAGSQTILSGSARPRLRYAI